MKDNNPSSYTRRILILSVTTGLPGVLFTLSFLITGDFDLLIWLTVLFVLFTSWGITLFFLQESIFQPWQTISNILSSFRENDYSLRGSSSNTNNPIGLAQYEINQLADKLQSERHTHKERFSLLQKILKEVDVAIYCFDDNQKLVMVNDYGAKMFGQKSSKLQLQSIDDLGLSFALEADHESVHQFKFSGKDGRWLVRKGIYRGSGKPYQMLLLTDISATLREEELHAWQKLIRVLSHEINNSMTPLKITAEGLDRLIQKDPLPTHWKSDFREGFSLISNRVDNLSQFVEQYSQLAKHNTPRLKPCSFLTIAQTVANFDPRCSVDILTNEDVTIEIDEAQIQQVLINLVKNSIEAINHNYPKISLSWTIGNGAFVIQLTDNGHGVLNPENLFVPYFSTKEHGSGIGLIISRQIIEAHNGALNLKNRIRAKGCIATISLPLNQPINNRLKAPNQ